MLTRSSINKLTALLALKATGLEQDWDVELADDSRIGEFLVAYEELSLSSDDKFALMALMLASVDRYVEAKSEVPHEWERIAQILMREGDLHKETVAYWRCDGEDDSEGWFHLTPHIRSLSEHASIN